jgi:CheY-like chemotaxis protein
VHPNPAPSERVILVVDDDHELLKLCATALRSHGHVVDTMDTGFGVVNRVAGVGGDKPDLVILDNYLPAMPGLVLLELLARNPATRMVPVILYSSDTGLAEAVAAAKHPACFYFPKGSVLALLKEVKRILSVEET